MSPWQGGKVMGKPGVAWQILSRSPTVGWPGNSQLQASRSPHPLKPVLMLNQHYINISVINIFISITTNTHSNHIVQHSGALPCYGKSLKRMKSLQSVNWGVIGSWVWTGLIWASQPRQMVKETRDPGKFSWVWMQIKVTHEKGIKVIIVRVQGQQESSANPSSLLKAVLPWPTKCASWLQSSMSPSASSGSSAPIHYPHSIQLITKHQTDFYARGLRAIW